MANKDLSRRTKGGWYYNLSFERRTALWGVIFLLPWLIGFILFTAKPIVELFVYSFHSIKLERGGQTLTPVQWENFKYIFTEHATYNQMLIKDLGSAIPSLLMILIFSLIVAIILNGKFKGRAIFRAIMFIPIIMAMDTLGGVVGGAQSMMLQQSQGEQMTGVQAITEFILDIMPTTELAQTLLQAVSSIFETVLLSGVQTLIFLGGLQSINPSLYEVAHIEGSTSYETFWKVTLPMLSPLILTTTVYTLSEHFMRSKIIEVAYDLAFKSAEFGRAAAMNVVFLIVSVLVIGIVTFIVSRKVFYYD